MKKCPDNHAIGYQGISYVMEEGYERLSIYSSVSSATVDLNVSTKAFAALDK